MGRPVLGLRGRHQAHNAAVAVLALEACGERDVAAPREAIVRGLTEARWPARLDLIDLGTRSLLVDGAHNASGARALADCLRVMYPEGLPLVFGVMADKALLPMLDRAFAVGAAAHPHAGRREGGPRILTRSRRSHARSPIRRRSSSSAM